MAASNDPVRDGWMKGLLGGAFLLFEGTRFIRTERRLWMLALVPVFFTFICVLGAAALFGIYLESIHEAWREILPVLEAENGWSWIWVGPGKLFFWLVGWLAVLASLALALIAGLLIANLASAPFLDLLSQRVEEIESGHPPHSEGGGLGTIVRDGFASFLSELQRLVFLAGIWIGLSLLGFLVPGGQLITGPALVVLTILFLPLDYAGFALDRRGLRFSNRRKWLLENRSLMLGFGSVAFVACLVPGLNLIILPAQVTAGTLLVLRRPPES